MQLLIGAEHTGVGGGVLDGFVVSYDGGEFCEALIPATTTTSPDSSWFEEK